MNGVPRLHVGAHHPSSLLVQDQDEIGEQASDDTVHRRHHVLILNRQIERGAVAPAEPLEVSNLHQETEGLLLFKR